MVTKEESRVNRESEKLFSVVTHYSKADNYPLQISVPNYLVHYTGDAGKALFLAQLIYWNDRAVRVDGYFWKSKQDWHKEIGIKKKTLERYEQEFVQAGFLSVVVKKAHGFPTNHYKINMTKLTDCIINTLQHKEMAVTHETAKRSYAKTQ